MDNLTIIENAADRTVADWLEQRLADALVAAPGPVPICVPGGTTPFGAMELLTRSTIDWSRIVVWPGDDRVVAQDHPASNTGKLRALFEPVGATVMNLTIMEQVPPFALVWLGMGTDGHVASLFASADPKVDDERKIRRLTPDPLPPEAPFDRVTLTLPALLDSREIAILIRGDDKRAVFDAAVKSVDDGQGDMSDRASVARCGSAGDMFRLTDVPLVRRAHRLAYRAADRLRKIYWRIAQPTLRGVAVIGGDGAGRVLLVRLSYGAGGWTVPGGGIKRGETPAEAAHREFREETGCTADGLRLLDVQTDRVHGTDNVVHVFAATAQGNPTCDDAEVVEARFFPCDALPDGIGDLAKRRLALFAAHTKTGG